MSDTPIADEIEALHLARTMLTLDDSEGAIATIARALLAMHEELDAAESLVAKHVSILTGVANALRGEPAPLATHGHHDLAERAATVVRERDEALAIIEGSETPPNDDEIEAHYAAGGRWCIADNAGAGDVRRVIATVREIAEWHREREATWRWIPLDRDRRPCKRPVVP